MREITYSQDLIIEDASLLTTLCIFCGKVWLPNPSIVDAAVDAMLIRDPSYWAKNIKRLQSDPTRQRVFDWEERNACLYKEGAIQTLPPHRHGHEEKHRPVSPEPVYDPEAFGPYATIALHVHISRSDLPGIEFFDTATTKRRIDLAGSIFHLQLPKLNADPERILDLRNVAQKSNISQFWEMIDEQEKYAAARGEPNLVRAEKIREEFNKWNKDRWQFRGKSLFVAALITLAWYSSSVIAGSLSTIPAAQWIGEVTQRWAQRKEKEARAFKFITRVDRKLKRIARSC